jgi:hypothetical protein
MCDFDKIGAGVDDSRMAIDQFEPVEIVPGVVGPEQIVNPNCVIRFPGGKLEATAEVTFDRQRRRYLLTALSCAEGLTAENLRYAKPTFYIATSVLMSRPTTLPNPEHLDPWGLDVPEDVRQAGIRTGRGLEWVRHLEAYAKAISDSPTKIIVNEFRVSAATAGRWLAKARKKD